MQTSLSYIITPLLKSSASLLSQSSSDLSKSVHGTLLLHMHTACLLLFLPFISFIWRQLMITWCRVGFLQFTHRYYFTHPVWFEPLFLLSKHFMLMQDSLCGFCLLMLYRLDCFCDLGCLDGDIFLSPCHCVLCFHIMLLVVYLFMWLSLYSAKESGMP